MSHSRKPEHPGTDRALAGILRRLRWVGLGIELFITVREGEKPVEVSAPPETIRFVLLSASDIADLVRLDPGTDEPKVARWFEEGKLCYGIRDDGRLIARMWVDLEEFNYPPARRRLAPNEAYLFAAYIDPGYRGQNLAPLLRAHCYESLEQRGRSRLCSYTDYFNTPARRFKLKLGARDEALKMRVELFGRWATTVTLRSYRPAAVESARPPVDPRSQ